MSLVETSSANAQFKLIVNETWCKGCRICVDLCPTDTLVMMESPDRWEGSIVKVANMEACNGCGICEVECPDFAISIFAAGKVKAAAGGAA